MGHMGNVDRDNGVQQVWAEGNGAHGQWKYRGQWGTQDMGHMDNRDNGAQGVWGTRGMGHMGNGTQGAMGTGGMGHMGNGAYGQWGQGQWGTGV